MPPPDRFCLPSPYLLYYSKSITKARKNKVVIEKLTNLIKENNIVKKYNKVEDYNNVSREIRNDIQNSSSIQEIKDQSIESYSPVEQQETLDNISSCAIANVIDNSHLNEFSYDSVLGNRTSIGAYGGSEFASPFSSYYN